MATQPPPVHQPSAGKKRSMSIRFRPAAVTDQDQVRFASYINSLSISKVQQRATPAHATPVINPLILFSDCNPRYYWDIYICVLLFYVSSVSVFAYSFVGSDLKSPHPLFWIERFLDVSFAVDIVLNLFTTFVPYDQRYVRPPTLRATATAYLSSYFIFDVLATIPWDVFTGTHSVFQIFRFIRLVRLLKLFRFVKVLRSRHSLVRWEVRFGLKYGYVRLLSLAVALMFIAHWVACLFYFFGTVPASTDDNFSEAWTEDDTKVPTDQYGRYMMSLYFSVYTITTIGYGDVVPGTTIERTYTTIIMFLGAACFAWAISQISSIFADLREPSSIYRRKMDALTDFCRIRALPEDLAVKLRRHCQKYYSHRRIDEEQKEVLEVLNHDLRLQTLRSMYEPWVRRLTVIFPGTNDADFDPVYLALQERFQASSDELYDIGDVADGLYIIKSGSVVLRTDRQQQQQQYLNNNTSSLSQAIISNNAQKRRGDLDDLDGGDDEATTASTDPNNNKTGAGGHDVDMAMDGADVQELTHGDVFGDDEVVVEQLRLSSAVVKETSELLFVPRRAIVESLKRNKKLWMELRSEHAKQLWIEGIETMQHHIMLARASGDLRLRQVAAGQKDGGGAAAIGGPSGDRYGGDGISSGSVSNGEGSHDMAGNETERLKQEVEAKSQRIKRLEEQLEVLQRQVKTMVSVFQEASPRP